MLPTSRKPRSCPPARAAGAKARRRRPRLVRRPHRLKPHRHRRPSQHGGRRQHSPMGPYRHSGRCGGCRVGPGRSLLGAVADVRRQPGRCCRVVVGYRTNVRAGVAAHGHRDGHCGSADDARSHAHRDCDGHDGAAADGNCYKAPALVVSPAGCSYPPATDALGPADTLCLYLNSLNESNWSRACAINVSNPCSKLVSGNGSSIWSDVSIDRSINGASGPTQVNFSGRTTQSAADGPDGETCTRWSPDVCDDATDIVPNGHDRLADHPEPRRVPPALLRERPSTGTRPQASPPWS